jgi:hypothetical protein
MEVNLVPLRAMPSPRVDVLPCGRS